MRNHSSFLLVSSGLFLTFFLVVLYSCQNQCQIPLHLKVAVLDGARIKAEAIPFVRVHELRERLHENVQSEVLEKEKKLKELYLELQKMKEHNKAFEKKKKNFDDQMEKLQSFSYSKLIDIKEKIIKITDKLEKKLDDSIKEIADKACINLILNTTIEDKRSVFYVTHSLDITNTVIDIMNTFLQEFENDIALSEKEALENIKK